MIEGTRVGVRTERRPTDDKACWRCGVMFNPVAENVIQQAPCKDCRATLRAEGDYRPWGIRAEANRKRAA